MTVLKLINTVLTLLYQPQVSTLVGTTSADLANNTLDWLNIRRQELTDVIDFPFLVSQGVITTVANYDTGTVSITSGGTIVTGSGTTFTSSMVGRKIRFDGFDDEYRISAFSSSTSITIDSAYSGTTDISSGSYNIYQDEYSLASNFSRPYLFRQHQTPTVIRWEGLNTVRDNNPSNLVLSDPTTLTILKEDSSQNKVVLLSPATDIAMRIDYDYITKVTDYTTADDNTEIPYEMDEVLLQGVYVYMLKRLADTREVQAEALYQGLKAKLKGRFGPWNNRTILSPVTVENRDRTNGSVGIYMDVDTWRRIGHRRDLL